LATKIHSHYHRRLSSYVVSQYDPTRTTSLRNQFARDMDHRFFVLCKVIQKSIVDEDCFALAPGSGGFAAHAEPTTTGRYAFDFPRSGDKVAAFMKWFDRQVQAGVLEVTDMPQFGSAVEEIWANRYIQSAYQKGIVRARQELIGAGIDVPSIEDSGGIGVAFNQPFHIDRLGLIYSRTYSGLKGITAAMDSQISGILGQGIAEGRHPRELARLLTRTITGPSGDLGITDTLGRFIPAKRRANMLARTEIIRAHHIATIQEYKNWGLAGVIVKAEWMTAGDAVVCTSCGNMQGRIFDLNTIEGMIPFHPNCRCIALPVDMKGKVTPPIKLVTPPPVIPEIIPEVTIPETAIDTASLWAKFKEREGNYYAVKKRSHRGRKVRLAEAEMREARIRWVASLPEDQYMQERQVIFNRIAPTVDTNKMIDAANYLPYDALEAMDYWKLRIIKDADPNFRAHYSPWATQIVLASRNNSATWVIAHELGHAMDDIVWNRKFTGVKTFSLRQRTGMQGMGNEFVSRKELNVLRKEYDDLIRRDPTTGAKLKGTYTNGDGDYWLDDWIDDYEGRIYLSPDVGDGSEWISMNAQRYQEYVDGLNVKYDKILDDAKRLAESSHDQDIRDYYKRKYEGMISQGKEDWSAKYAHWDEVRKRYPKLAKFFEKFLGDGTKRIARKDLEL
jgi:SPP1 gp7 family putative phage head morphogenesis protein